MFKTDARARKAPPGRTPSVVASREVQWLRAALRGGVPTALYDCFNGYTLFTSPGGRELERDIRGELSSMYYAGRDTLSTKHHRERSEEMQSFWERRPGIVRADRQRKMWARGRLPRLPV